MEISLEVGFKRHCSFAVAEVSIWRLLDVAQVPVLYFAPV
jgi:hypothetical protein